MRLRRRVLLRNTAAAAIVTLPVVKTIGEAFPPMDPKVVYLTPAGYWKFANKAVALFIRRVSDKPAKGFLANVGGHEIYMVHDSHLPTASNSRAEDALIDRILERHGLPSV